MKRTYSHLTQEERYHIETQCKQKMSLSQIAKGIGRHRATLSRKLKRNTGQRGYRYSTTTPKRQTQGEKNGGYVAQLCHPVLKETLES